MSAIVRQPTVNKECVRYCSKYSRIKTFYVSLGCPSNCSVNDKITTWDDLESGAIQPTEAEISDKMDELQAAADALEWQTSREEEYPEYGAQFNKIYDDGLTKWKAEMVDPVKAKWPKDNSGPIE